MFDQEKQMKKFKRALVIVISILMLANLNVPCSAADSALKDSGSLVKTPAEGAQLVLASTPADHLDYLSIGAATDVLTAGTSTMASPAKSLFAIKNGTVKIALPAITPEFQENSAKGLAGMMLKAELISGTF